jgi:acid phosphatase (class A)
MKAIFLLGLLAFAVPGDGAIAADFAFVTPAEVQGAKLLPPPPASDSDATKAELAELHAIEASRTAADAARAYREAGKKSIFLFDDVFGEKFTETNLPRTADFGMKLRKDELAIVAAAKKSFGRPHPYKLDPTLHPACKINPSDDAYPSGHTTSVYVFALALIDMVPERRDDIFSRAAAYAHERLVCGSHYPGDLVAGQRLAEKIHAAMAGNPAYRKALAAARGELRGMLGPVAAP